MLSACTTAPKQSQASVIPAEVGFQVTHLAEMKNKLNQRIDLYSAMPCDECDVEHDLVVYNSATKKMVRISLPGQYFYGEYGDPGQPNQEVYGFYGRCAEGNLGVITLSKSRTEEQSTWSQKEVSFKYSLEKAEFDPEGNPVATDSSISATEFKPETFRKINGCIEIPGKRIELP